MCIAEFQTVASIGIKFAEDLVFLGFYSFAALRSYEGHYKTRENKRLELAASPVDTVLWAVLGKSRYPLKIVGADLFISQNGDSIRFQRNSSGSIKSYTLKK